MKNRFFPAILTGALLLLNPSRFVNAFEFEIIGGVNNMTFLPDRTEPHGESADSREFEPFLFPFGDLIIRGNISNLFGYNIHASRDNILANNLYAKFTVETNYFNAGFGPYINMTDDFDIPILGLTADFVLVHPGMFLVSMGGSISLGSGLDFLRNDSQRAANIQLGLRLQNVIPVVSGEIKSFTRYPGESGEIQDELLRFKLSADIFAKNFPFIFRIDAGYDILSRFYDAEQTADTLKSFFAGAEIRWQVSAPVQLIAGFEIPVYTLPEAPLLQEESIFNLYKAYAGISFRFFPVR